MSAIFNLFYIYDPWLFHFFRMAFFIGLVSFIILCYKFYKKSVFTQGIVIPIDSIIVLLLLIGLSFIPIVINGTSEMGVVLQYVKLLLLFGCGVLFYNLFYRIENGKALFVRDLKIGIGVQSIVGLLALMGIPIIIELALSTNVILPRFYGSEQEYRLYNITSMAFFQLSIFYLLLLHFLLAYNEKSNTVSGLIFFLLLFIGLISGRTFLFLSVLSFLIYFRLRYLPVLLTFFAICLFFSIKFPEHKYVLHALEPMINILKLFSSNISNGNALGEMSDLSQLSSSSDNLVKNHLYIPEIKQILLGDGLYYTEDGRYYGATDSGFLRQILYGGVGYLFLCFMVTSYFVYRIAQNWFNTSWKFILSTILIFSILHIKADTYAFPGIMFILLMFLSLFGSSGKQIVLFRQRGYF